jgi:hypothetical protein
MREHRIGRNDLDQTLVKELDVGSEPRDTAARKTLQHRVFQQSGGILGGDFLGTELAANSKHLGELLGCRRRPLRWSVGMMATNDAIIRASSGSFFARTPLALANCRSLNGLTWRTGMSAACKERITPRS